MHNKRGQGLSTNTIILLILGVLVLVFLIIGFTAGFGKITPFIKPGNNVKEVKQGCEIACSTNADYDFCYVKRELKAEDKALDDVNCNYLAEKQTKYGIDQCSTISCNVIFVDLLTGEILQDKCSDNLGKTVQALVDDTLQSVDC